MSSETKSKFIDVKTLSGALPKDVRQKIRKKELVDGQPTTGMCEGYTQANLSIVHKSLADDFEKFCHANSGPLPLLYKSKPGEYAAPALSQHDSDIRSDVSMYNVLVNGKKSGSVGSLLEYEQEMKEMSTFYLGCSFSFEDALAKARVPLRNVEQNLNVSMYNTNIRCHPVGVFDCYQVVSMRPIPRNKIETAFQVTHPLIEVHGAPAHIGDPAMIGITDINKADYGCQVKFQEGDIPLFWSCGVTGLMALQSANSPLAFTHYPGCMYISDTPVKIHDLSSLPDKPKVIALKEEPFFASVTAESVVSKVKALEECIQDDPGVIPKSLDVTSFPPSGQDANLQTAREFLSGEDELHPKYQHLVAIERVGRASDKTWRSMRAVDLTSLVSPIDLLFDAAKDMPYVSTTGIGDGGNELGMGKVKDRVVEHINQGSEVACEVAADYLITAGVSDWGGFALSMALYAVSLCPVHDRYLRRNVGFPLQKAEDLQKVFPTVERQEAMLTALVDHGIHDGILQQLSMSVDGLPFHPVHAEKLHQLNKFVL
ncbi:D-glutamate cyclase, mitochondrial-like isoform X3 [Ptychodera flava]|uniref:D-glutamate cyclase, mitochondrial-like isoform X3 n=1 Tax=Ptychodera flava TaxID=63121 RepID=UPI00396A6D05